MNTLPFIVAMGVIAAMGAGILLTTALLEIRHRRGSTKTSLAVGAIAAVGAVAVTVVTGSALPVIALLGAVVCGVVTAFHDAKPVATPTA